MNATSFCKILFFMGAVFFTSCRKDEEEIPEPSPINQNISCSAITTPTVWTNVGDGVDYYVDCNISVSAKLTIEPGVVIHFKNNASITIESAGALVAVGTASSPIVLEGDSPLAGYWKGIYIKSNSPENELNYCTISHGGSASFDGNADYKANIRLKETAQLIIRNSIISRSGQDGIYIEGLNTASQNPLSLYSANQIIDNGRYPISCIAASIHALDGTLSSYSGNTNPYINVRGGRLYGDPIWENPGISFQIENTVFVGYSGNAATLNILPGCKLAFVSGSGLVCGDFGAQSGLVIEGTPSERIELTGKVETAGSWKGIAFFSNNPINSIKYTDIRFGGASSLSGNTAQKGNILVGLGSSPGYVSIANSSLSSSDAYGMYVTSWSTGMSEPTSVTYSGNVSGNYFQEP
jgi:hypothetical protein